MVLPRKRVRLEVELEMDPIPGTFNTPESCRDQMRQMLKNQIPHYAPHVRISDMQPIVYDKDCPECDTNTHRCYFCGDEMNHSGRSTVDGHTAKDCAE